MRLIPHEPRLPAQRMSVSLGGATYRIAWLWNERDRAWSFSMWDPSGEPRGPGAASAERRSVAVGARGRSATSYPIVVVDHVRTGLEPNAKPGSKDQGRLPGASVMSPNVAHLRPARARHRGNLAISNNLRDDKDGDEGSRWAPSSASRGERSDAPPDVAEVVTTT